MSWTARVGDLCLANVFEVRTCDAQLISATRENNFVAIWIRRLVTAAGHMSGVRAMTAHRISEFSSGVACSKRD